MEIKDALEAIVDGLTERGWQGLEIRANFLHSVSYIDQAAEYRRKEWPLQNEVAADLYLRAFQDLKPLDRKYEKLYHVLKQLSWYEYSHLATSPIEEATKTRLPYDYRGMGARTIRRYEQLGRAEKALVNHYFADAIAEIKKHTSTQKGKHRKKS